MKKMIAALCLSAILLTGCSEETSFLKPYQASNADSTTNVSTMIDADVFKTFASDLGVVSTEDADLGIYPENSENEDCDDLSASEVFLAGTTDNQVLAAYNIYKQMPPASLTKILTALVALKYGPDLDSTVTLNDDCVITTADAQVCGFEPGDEIRFSDLLNAMLVYSGNDAANAVASYVSDGNIPEFCEMMNEEAASLGATQTHFVTPNGLDDPDHYTSAYDLYIIFKECLKYDAFVDAISQTSFSCTYKHNGEDTTQTWPSTSYYFLGYKTPPEGVTIIGGKTGTTGNAGTCLILYVEDSEGNGYISLLLGCPDKDTLYDSMTKLLSNIQK